MSRAHQFPLVALLLGVFLFVFTGCAPVYVPNSVHTPMLEDKGDGQVSGFVGSSGFDVQTALGVSDHIGVSADFSYGQRADEEDDDFHRHQFGEVGIGYFNDISSWSQFEVYGGYGRGQAETVDEYVFITQQEIRATGRYDRFFVQPALGFEVGPLRMNGAVRLARVNFYEFETSRETQRRNNPVLFYEPALGLSVGTRAARVGVQAGASVPNQDPADIDFDYQPLWLSLGVTFSGNIL